MKPKHFFQKGAIEVVHGLQEVGKSRFLEKRAKLFEKRGIPFVAFDPIRNSRSQTHITSFLEGNRVPLIPCIKVDEKEPWDILEYIVNQFGVSNFPKAVLIDEIQFFSKEIIEVAFHLAKENDMHFIAAGVTEDNQRDKFGFTQDLILMADFAQKLNPPNCIIENCGEIATAMTALYSNGEPVEWRPTGTGEIGDSNSANSVSYHPMCDLHHINPSKPVLI